MADCLSLVWRANCQVLPVWLGLLFVFGCAAHQGDLRPKLGFRDIAWETPIDNMPSMVLMDKGGGRWKWAKRASEDLKLGDVDVDSITYIYVDGVFAGVDMVYAGADRFGQLMRQIRDQLGPPNVVNKNMNMVSWHRDGATVLLRFYRLKGNGTLRYAMDKLTVQ